MDEDSLSSLSEGSDIDDISVTSESGDEFEEYEEEIEFVDEKEEANEIKNENLKDIGNKLEKFEEEIMVISTEINSMFVTLGNPSSMMFEYFQYLQGRVRQGRRILSKNYNNHYQKNRSKKFDPKNVMIKYLNMQQFESEFFETFTKDDLFGLFKDEVTKTEKALNKLDKALTKKEKLKCELIELRKLLKELRETLKNLREENSTLLMVDSQITKFDTLAEKYGVKTKKFLSMETYQESMDGVLENMFYDIRSVFYDILELRKEMMLNVNIFNEIENEKIYKKKLSEKISMGMSFGSDIGDNEMRSPALLMRKKMQNLNKSLNGIMSPNSRQITTLVEDCQSKLYSLTLDIEDSKLHYKASIEEINNGFEGLHKTYNLLNENKEKLTCEMRKFAKEVKHLTSTYEVLRHRILSHKKGVVDMTRDGKKTLRRLENLASSPLKEEGFENSPIKKEEMYFNNCSANAKFRKLHRILNFIKDCVRIYLKHVDKLKGKIHIDMKKNDSLVNDIVISLKPIKEHNETIQKQNCSIKKEEQCNNNLGHISKTISDLDRKISKWKKEIIDGKSRLMRKINEVKIEYEMLLNELCEEQKKIKITQEQLEKVQNQSFSKSLDKSSDVLYYLSGVNKKLRENVERNKKNNILKKNNFNVKKFPSANDKENIIPKVKIQTHKVFLRKNSPSSPLLRSTNSPSSPLMRNLNNKDFFVSKLEKNYEKSTYEQKFLEMQIKDYEDKIDELSTYEIEPIEEIGNALNSLGNEFNISNLSFC